MRLQHPFMNVGVVLKNLTLLIFILQLCACSQSESFQQLLENKMQLV